MSAESFSPEGIPTAPAGEHGLVAPLRVLTLLVVLCVSGGALLLAPFSPPARAAGCPNDGIRVEQGPAALALPDCRAYELVSPGVVPYLSSNNGSGVETGRASPDGNSLVFSSRYPAPASETYSEPWLAQRGGAGWGVTGLDPQMTVRVMNLGICNPGTAFSEDLTSYVLSAGGDLRSANPYSVPGGSDIGECEMPQDELVAGEPRGYSNLYLRQSGAPYVLVNALPAGFDPANATYQAASADLSRIVFEAGAEVDPGDPPGFNLFEWADGIVRPLGVLPTGETVSATLARGMEPWGYFRGRPHDGLARAVHAVSRDGERVFFEAAGGLYLRENAGQPSAADANCRTTSEPALACTRRIDVSQGGIDEAGGGVFQFASQDGDRVFFTSDRKLTQHSNAEAGKPDLYEFRVATRKVIDLTEGPSAANVRGVSGGSDDGTHLYFVARGVLTGSENNAQGELAQTGEPNLYLVRDGELTYVATLSPWISGVNFTGGRDRDAWWEPGIGILLTAWSPSGRYLAFGSVKPLTGFDNTPPQPELCETEDGGLSPCRELFVYDAETEELSCVSCDPGGAKPVGHTELLARREFDHGSTPRYFPRAVLDSGQVFFETRNSLIPRDVNGAQDVYEYRSGNLNLISSGMNQSGSVFVDASPDGSDVFFISPEALVRSDGDGGAATVYDARVDGGFAEPPLPPEPCGNAESCRSAGPPAPPAVAQPSTSSFFGQGNIRPRPCKHGRVRRGNRCVRRVKHHHRKQRASRRPGRSN